jgi:hypothetical protein
MSILQISKIQQRSGNLVDLPQLDEAEFGWASDNRRLFIGKTSPNENVEILTAYSNINFSQISGSYGNLNINPVNLGNGEVLTFDGTNWVNRGGAAGGEINLGNVSNVTITGGAIGYVLQTDGLGNLSWTPKSTLVSYIENVSSANPGILTTVSNHNLSKGTSVTITGAQGMTQLNGNAYYANVLTSNTFSLYSDSGLTTPVNTIPYTSYAFTSVSNTTTGTNYVTVGNSAVLSVNQAVQFVGNMSNTGISSNTTYYINSKPNGTSITVSNSIYANGTAGPILSLSTANGLVANVYQTGGQIVSIASGGSGAGAAGSNTQIQYNNNGILQASSTLTFDYANNILLVGGNANVANLNSTGIVTAVTLSSNVATGTAPITVNSTTKVANLNADFVDGYNTSVTTSANTIVVRDANGNISGNAVTANSASLGTLAVTRTSNLGPVGNVTITGGTTGQYLQTNGSGVLSWATVSTIIPNISNGTSNVNINAVNGNVGVSVAGTSNVLLVTGTGANISGYANITGNVSAGNISGTLLTGTLTTATQPNITSVGTLTTLTVGNATANTIVGNGNITTTGSIIATGSGSFSGGLSTTTLITTGNVTTANVFASGTLSVGGNITGGNLFTTGSANAASLTTTGNITSGNLTTFGLANVGSLSTTGIISATGNVTGGNLITTGSANVGSIVSSGSGSFNGGLFTTTLNTTGNVTTANVFAVGSLLTTGNITGANLITAGLANVGSLSAAGSITGGNLTTSGSANVGSLSATGNVTGGNLITAGSANVGSLNVLGTIVANGYSSIIANGSGSFNGGLYTTTLIMTGDINTANVFASGTLSVGGNITGGNLFTTGSANVGSLSATGNITGGNLKTFGAFSVSGISNLGPVGNVVITGGTAGYYLQTNGSGVLSWQPVSSGTALVSGNSNVTVAANSNVNISSNGVANVLVVTGTGVNIAGTLNATGVITGNGAGLTQIPGGNVVGAVAYATTANAVALANVSGIGNIASINLNGSSSQILYGNGAWAASSATYSNSNVATLLSSFGSNTISTTGNISGGNINGVTIYGAGTGLTGSSPTFTANNANYLGNYSWASPPQIGSTTANYAAFSGLTVNGTISSANITSSGNVSAANVNVTTGVIYGNGSGLSAITGANVTGTVANATYAVSAGSAATATNATYATSAGSAATATNATYATTAGTAGSATTAGTVTTNAQPNITSIGTLAGLYSSSTVDALTPNNGTTGGLRLRGNSITSNAYFQVTDSTATNQWGVWQANVSGNIGWSGNLTTYGIFYGNGSGLSAIAGANVTGAVPNATYATYATSAGSASSATTATIATIAAAVTANNQPNITSVSTSFSNLTFAANGNITMSGANSTLSGANLVNANYFTGTLTTAAQPNITSVGTLTGLAVGGNTQISSLGVGTAAVGTSGEIVATNNIIAYYSDGRLKDVLGTIESPIEKIKQISGVRFTSNDTAAKYGYTDKKVQIGVIAQEIEAILPEIVVPAPFDMGTDEDGNPISKSGENYKTVHYDKIIPLLIEAIKEQQKQIEELQSRISNGNS